MATLIISKTQCSICKKQIRTFICRGCSKDFCSKCLSQHLESLGQELDEIATDYDQFRHFFNEEQQNPSNRSTIDEINKWEEDSINKIKQRANECRERLFNYRKNYFIEIEDRLNNLAKELKQTRQENEYNELDINQLKEKLNKLRVKLDQLSNISISIEEKSSFFINDIIIIDDKQWEEDGTTIAGGNGQGNKLNQLDRPLAICIDDDQTLYIADYGNNRIVKWKSNSTIGQVIADSVGKGNQTNQLKGPTNLLIDKQTNSLIIADHGNRRVIRWSLQNNTQHGEIMISDIGCYGLAMNKNGDLYVLDCKKNEVRRYKKGEKNGTIVAGGNGQGDRLNQLNYPTYICVDENDSLYVSDRDNHRVMKWTKDAKQGAVVAGGNGKGNSLAQLSNPQGVIVDQLGQIYVTDTRDNLVMRWCEGDEEGSIVVGGNDRGDKSNQLNLPAGLSFDREGNLYVVDCMNHRVQKYEIE